MLSALDNPLFKMSKIILYYTQFSNYLGRIMQRNNSQKFHCRSNSTSRHHQVHPSFRTILKRRNETIAASQLYQDLPTPHSHNKIMTQSQVEFTPDGQAQKCNQLDIRQYVKKMGTKKETQMQRNSTQRFTTQAAEEQNNRRTARLPIQSPQSIAQQRLPESKGKKSIDELQNKIEAFVNQSLIHLRLQRRNIGLSQWSQLRKTCSIDKEVEDIYEYFNELTLQIGQNDPQNEKLADLNRKIQILQKMLASQCAESQLLKLQYYGWKNQRGNTTSYSSKQLLSDANRLNRQNKPLSLNRDHSQKAKQITPLSSTAKNSFMKPSKEYYLTTKEKKNSFSLNRQPMPRSSYSAQYLNYGHIPTYSYKPDTIRQSPEASLAVKASTYQQEYKDKLGVINKVNFKQLDCFRDKFKNTDISFMNCSKKHNYESSENLKKKLKNSSNIDSIKQNSNLVIPRQGSDSSLIRFMHFSSADGFYKTQTQKQFNWENTIFAKVARDPLKSEIKDKKLGRLKEAFKNLVIRD